MQFSLLRDTLLLTSTGASPAAQVQKMPKGSLQKEIKAEAFRLACKTLALKRPLFLPPNRGSLESDKFSEVQKSPYFCNLRQLGLFGF